MIATQELPDGYQQTARLDLTKDKKALVWLNIVGMALLVFFGWLFMQWIIWLRPLDMSSLGFSINGLFAWLILIFVLLAATVTVIFLHEGVHGLAFWLMFHQKPTFGFRGAYAFAASPGWFLPRAPYLVVATAPLVGLSLVSLGLMLVVPAGWLVPIALFAALNASGAVGDLAVTVWLLFKPATTLIEDTGETITFYEKEKL